MKLEIDAKKELFIWGPVDGRPVYPDCWNEGMSFFSKDCRPGWPTNFFYCKDEKFVFISDKKKLYGNGEEIFKKYVINEKIFNKKYEQWESMLKIFENFYNKIRKEKLSKLSENEISKKFIDFLKLYCRDFWRYGLLPEIANWGGESILTKELRKYTKNEKDFIEAMEVISAPEKSSFYQIEELDLLKIAKEKNSKKREQKIKKHQDKYFWMLNSYHHTKVLAETYFRKELKKYSIKNAELRIKEILQRRNDLLNKKSRIVKNLNLFQKVQKIGKKLAFCIWWQDIRKSYIFKANHILEIFLEEFSRRYKINNSDLHYYRIDDLKKLIIKKIKVHSDEIEKRKKHLIIAFLSNNKNKYFSGDYARKIFSPFNDNSHRKETKLLKGLVVNRGKAKGKVRIIESPNDSGKMKNNEILVAPMTSPDFILALKKAKAIITDQGGMTCHAAIVSRELNIPGIVATKIATKVLKNGDKVEVDADKGIVKILKKK